DELIFDDPMPLQRGNISSFGLLELTRRSKNIPLDSLLLEKKVAIKSVAAKCLDIIRTAEQEALNSPGLPVTIIIDNDEKKWLEDHSQIFDDFRIRTGSELKMERR
ncbi:hypothetical protein, partial [Pseudemcibacter sp.]|uniref:hypothetical protein n=1 Tax=Pseudemcibacter sp. TaxID=2943293 RepID=UPI003F69E906